MAYRLVITVDLPIECCYVYGALVTGGLDENGYSNSTNSSLCVILVFTLKHLVKTANINTKNLRVSRWCYRRPYRCHSCKTANIKFFMTV